MEAQEKIEYLEDMLRKTKYDYFACKRELEEQKVISLNRKKLINAHRKSIYELNEAIRNIKRVAKDVQPEDEQPIQE